METEKKELTEMEFTTKSKLIYFMIGAGKYTTKDIEKEYIRRYTTYPKGTVPYYVKRLKTSGIHITEEEEIFSVVEDCKKRLDDLVNGTRRRIKN